MLFQPIPPFVVIAANPPDTVVALIVLGTATVSCVGVFFFWVKSMGRGRTKSVLPKRPHRRGRFGK